MIRRKRYHVKAVNATRRAFLMKHKTLAYNARSFSLNEPRDDAVAPAQR
jgi:hypothetical protein